MLLNIGLNMSIVKTTLNTRENTKTDLAKSLFRDFFFEKWTPSQPSAHICACFFPALVFVFLRGH